MPSPRVSVVPSATDPGASPSRPDPLQASVCARRKLTIISMNLSTNCTNRCLRLAQALVGHFDVEIVGTTFGVGTRWGEGLWPPLEGVKDIPIRSVRGDNFPGYLVSLVKMLALIDGDIVIACKPRLPSLGIALIHKLVRRRPLILDIDDDEIAQTAPGKRASVVKQLISASGYFWSRVIHPLHRLADAKFVVSENFRTRYGGTIVPHPMDAREFDPERYDRARIREELGIGPDRIVVGFIGSPSQQKGTDLLLLALERIAEPRLLMMIVGAAADDAAMFECRRPGEKRLLLLPMQPLPRLPEFLAAADIIALPQRASAETWGQMPAKLSDAMAMGKPIVAARRSDIPKYLADGKGLLFEPDDIEDFVRQLEHLIANPEEWPKLGNAARQYFLQHLTMDAVGAIMLPVISSLLPQGRPSRAPRYQL